MHNIFRFMSRKPRLADWTAHIPSDTILVVLRSGGSLRFAAQTAFTSVHFTTRTAWRPGHGGVHVKGVAKEI